MHGGVNSGRDVASEIPGQRHSIAVKLIPVVKRWVANSQRWYDVLPV